jgi:hypothetical protein
MPLDLTLEVLDGFPFASLNGVEKLLTRILSLVRMLIDIKNVRTLRFRAERGNMQRVVR